LKGSTQSQPLSFIDVISWDGIPIPEREWAVKDRITPPNVSLCSGDGAVGKTTLLLQLSVAHTLGRDWFGRLPEPGPVIYLNAEDEARELHYRLAAICNHYSARFSELRDLYLISLAGEDAILARSDRKGIISPTRLLMSLRTAALDIRPKLIVLDPSADVFAGNENDRSQVRQFITLLRGLAIEANTAVLIASHPSLTGMNTGTGLSGTTAWHNSVRARLYLKGVKTGASEEADPDLRQLEVMKSNYGPGGERILMRWHQGIFIPETGPSSLKQRADARKAEEVFLDLIDRFEKQERPVSANVGPTYAPKLFADYPGVTGITKRAFQEAMIRLLDAGKICNERYGPPSRQRTRLRRAWS
jgi:RecA-family ATPase